MAKRIAVSTLNASTIDILNTIRDHAPLEYQDSIPVIEQATDIPKVGEIICGTPAFSNHFINALINRIALVQAQSATFNNPYAPLKKGYIEYGESIEDIFVQIAKVQVYDVEKAAQREFKRTLPDVKSVFHAINWRVVYPITIEDQQLQRAFLSAEGVSDLIAKIVDSIYVAAEYDEFLLFKYLLIKGVTKGKMKPVAIGDGTNLTVAAKKFRGISNILPFMKSEYNEFGVKTTTPKERQAIFMDAQFNADFDVDVLAGAFNMDKAEFVGKLHLIDDWTSFDNERWETIRAECDGVEAVTAEELALMADVKAVIVDENWFQVYDNLNKFTENYLGSVLYWNYFYHVWKTVSYSPFANAIVFVTTGATITEPASVTVTIKTKDVSDDATVMALGLETSDPTLQNYNFEFLQTEALVEDGIGVQPYGTLIIPASKVAEEITLVAKNVSTGTTYTASTTVTGANDVGDTITLAKA